MATKRIASIPAGKMYTTLGDLLLDHARRDGIPAHYDLVVKRNGRKVPDATPLVVKKFKATSSKSGGDKRVERSLETFESLLSGTSLAGQCTILLRGPSPTGTKTKTGGVDGHFKISRLAAHSKQIENDVKMKAIVLKARPRIEKQIDELHTLANGQGCAVVRAYVAVLLKRYGKGVFREGVGRLA